MLATASALLLALTQSPTQAIATAADFDLSKAIGATRMAPWRLPFAPQNMRSQLDSRAARLLDQALADIDTEKDHEWKARTLNDAANQYLLLDPTVAQNILDKAWTASEQIQSNAGLTQTGLVKTECGIDVEHARSLIGKIKDSYWVDFSKSQFGIYVGTYDFRRAATIFEAQSSDDRDRNVQNLAYDLMRDDPSAAIRLIRSVKGVDQDKAIGAVIYNLVDNSLAVAEPLIPEIQSADERDNTLLQIIAKVDDDEPDRAGATALTLREPRSRAAACAHMVRVYSRTAPAKARFMQLEALKAIKEYKGEYAEYAPSWLLPDVAFIDSPEVREFLTSQEKRAVASDTEWGDKGHLGTMPSEILPLAGAWVQIDQKKADDLIAQMLKVKPHGLVDYSDIGNRVNEGYVQYLAAVARHDPQHAAELVKPFLPKDQQFSELSLVKTYIVKALLPHDVAQARAFAVAIDDKLLLGAIDARSAAIEIKVQPEKAFTLIPKMQSMDWLLDSVDQTSVAVDAARAFVKKGDTASAIKIAHLVQDSQYQTTVLEYTAWALLRNNRTEQLMAVLDLAEKAASNGTAQERASNLVDLAGEILQMSGHHHWKD